NPADPHLGAEPRLLAHKTDKQKTYADRGHGKKIMPQSQGCKSHNRPQSAGDHNTCEERNRNGRAARCERGGSVRSRAIERRMPQTELAAESRDHVEAHGQHDVDAHDGKHAIGVGAHAVRAPASPCGRTSSTAMRNRNAMASRSRKRPMKMVP